MRKTKRKRGVETERACLTGVVHAGTVVPWNVSTREANVNGSDLRAQRQQVSTESDSMKGQVVLGHPGPFGTMPWDYSQTKSMF